MGVAQGTLVSIAFLVLGLPSPVLWGVVTALFSLIPIIGSAAVWAPAVMILVAGGHWWKALILLGWGAGVVGQVDSLVRPYVIGQRAKMHTLLVFFALLGGVKASVSWGFSSAPSFCPSRSFCLRCCRKRTWVTRRMDNPRRQPECFRAVKLPNSLVSGLSSDIGDTSAAEYLQRFKPQYV